MATDAFIQSGSGEVSIAQVLALKAKAFWTVDEKKVEADLYESAHPGVTVRRDWESAAELAARVKKRDAMPQPTAPTQGMDPSRAAPELLRQQRFLQTLSVDHPKYKDLFTAAVEQIHLLEDNLNLKRTEYKLGSVPKKEKESADPEALAKLAEYFKRNLDTRRRSIEATKDSGYLALIRDTETMPELQALAVQRIEQLRMNP
jgi:hypothetical protein